MTHQVTKTHSALTGIEPAKTGLAKGLGQNAKKPKPVKAGLSAGLGEEGPRDRYGNRTLGLSS